MRFRVLWNGRPAAILGARALLLSASVALGGIASGGASAALSSESENAMAQMRAECAKLHEEMKASAADGDATMEDSSLSPDMKEKHQMCMAMEHGPGDGDQNEEPRR